MKNIVVLVSGGGTNLQALIDAEKSGIIKGGKITCVISSKPGAYALERAANNGIPTKVIPRRDYADSVSYSRAILDALNEEKADLVVLAGFMTILHGDDRIYNNIIIQHYPVTDPEKTPADNDYEAAGTAPFDIFPSYEEWISHFMMDQEPNMGALATYHFGHLPVWVSGNAYFNGATVSKHEAHGLTDCADKVTVEWQVADGKVCLKTNVFDFLKDFRNGVICTETLGKAFEPEQRFENPDGTDIVFDRDYFGGHRGLETLPGPFAEGFDDFKALW